MSRVNTWATRVLSTLAHIVASISSPRMPFRRINPDQKDNVGMFCRSNKQVSLFRGAECRDNEANGKKWRGLAVSVLHVDNQVQNAPLGAR